MSKVITFSRHFQKNHPKAGQPTYFVEKMTKGNRTDSPAWYSIDLSGVGIFDKEFYYSDKCFPKSHTIRSGHRFKAGDYFSPRVWSGRPYASKQIIIAPDTEVMKTWDFEIRIVGLKDGFASKVFINGMMASPEILTEVAKNDGLNLEDFLSWFEFPKYFEGQIICWNRDINY